MAATPDPTQLAVFLAALRHQESGSLAGNYAAVNKSSGAKGAYQFLPGTDMYKQAQAAGWTPKAQDQIAAQTISAYYASPTIGNGDFERVARAWYGGPGAVNHPEWGAGKGAPTVGQYGQSVLGVYKQLIADPNIMKDLNADPGAAYGGGAFWAGPGNAGGKQGDPLFGTTSGPLASAWGAITDLPSAVEAMAKIASALATWLGNKANWLRIIEVIGGGIGVIVALSILSGKAQEITEAGAKVALLA